MEYIKYSEWDTGIAGYFRGVYISWIFEIAAIRGINLREID